MRVIVIGAGSVGANVAYRLARRGAEVVVLEANAPASGTSGASFAWANAFRKVPENYYALNLAGMQGHVELALELDEQLGGGFRESSWLHRDGGLHWEEAPEASAELRATAERLEAWGYPVEVITPEAARRLEPDLRFGPEVREVVYTPTEGYIEMAPFIGRLLASARDHGSDVRSGARVAGVLREQGQVVGVELVGGERLLADWVVDCAGPLADDVCRMAGVEMPFDRIPGRLVYTSPVATTLRMVIHAPGVHFRPDGGGRLVIGRENHDADVDLSAPYWAPERYVDMAARHLPAVVGARAEAQRVGVRPMPRDKKPMVGPLPGLDGFYLATSHSGVTLGPLWGMLVASELIDGIEEERLAPFRPGRFF
jgi:glycine/D-amino acid oxidase-like deaminating enzyme